MRFGTYTTPGTVGWIIALIVLILCVVLWFIGRPLTDAQTLGLIGAVALARLL
ncbi:MAG TPA: hypothetical protein VE842_11275 [Pyrinomonadaceae bacterium]|jgi:hypothetical protein|nr:hypothetical protein [Pyrinomonadaceae bacterium]